MEVYYEQLDQSEALGKLTDKKAIFIDAGDALKIFYKISGKKVQTVLELTGAREGSNHIATNKIEKCIIQCQALLHRCLGLITSKINDKIFNPHENSARFPMQSFKRSIK